MAIEIACTSSRSACKAVITVRFIKKYSLANLSVVLCCKYFLQQIGRTLEWVFANG